MTAPNERWTIRSVLISVRSLDRSVDFYRDVFHLQTIATEGEVTVLSSDLDAPFSLILREASGQAVRHGQQDLGARALTFRVDTRSDLDGVEDRLRRWDAFLDRTQLPGSEPFDLVRGNDPDGLPLVFMTYEGMETITVEHFRHAAVRMYGLDV